jgi:hypothetical protein
MSLRRADPRFALPRLARTATLVGELPGWRDGLEQAGVEVVSGQAELVVAPASRATEALALEPELVVLEDGRAARRLRAAGWSPLVLLPLPDVERPELLLPAGHTAPVTYAVRHWRPGTSAATRARNVLARELVGRGVVPPGRRAVTVASRSGGDPVFVQAAREALELEPSDWFAAFGRWAQRFSRGVFFLFAEREPAPAWALKFARIPGLGSLFDRDERGLRLAERSAAVVADHAPRLVGRLEVGGLHASVETAARGETLMAALAPTRPHTERLATVERIAEWLVRLGDETAAPPETLEPERRRLAAEVVPRWVAEGLPRTFVADLPPIRAVLQHGDVFGENVVLEDRGPFTVLDWESAREHGLPLWDLFYFLTRAIGVLDDLQTEAEREEHFVRLWRGELPSSELLFGWTRRAVTASGVPPAAVGPLATLLWLSYALLDLDEAVEIEQATGDAPPQPTTALFARRWLSEPGLGPGWDRWR